jgi:4'-phosphopantetheinyl transferase
LEAGLTIWEIPVGGQGFWQLPPDEVHLWRLGLELPDEALEGLLEALSADERKRSGRFRVGRERRRYVACRAALRKLLGGYMQSDPAQLELRYGRQGKPFLNLEGTWPLKFNLAHSHELALLAFAHGRELGVDLEWMRPLDDANAIAERFFSVDERTAFQALEPADRTAGFYRCWTRKEAYLKATGGGLVGRLEHFTVQFAAGQTAALLWAADDDPVRWTMTGLEPAAGYAGALVVEGYDWRLLARDFRWDLVSHREIP